MQCVWWKKAHCCSAVCSSTSEIMSETVYDYPGKWDGMAGDLSVRGNFPLGVGGFSSQWKTRNSSPTCIDLEKEPYGLLRVLYINRNY